jgi:hypothetical protein
MSLSPKNRLGVDGAQTKVDMGPIKDIHLVHLNIQRVLVNLGHQIGTFLGTQGLSNVTHM